MWTAVASAVTTTDAQRFYFLNMAVDKMQQQRFEQKYLVTEETALRIRDFVRTHLDLDENGLGKLDLSYSVHSLYLDSATLETYWATVNGNKNRFKLRLRFYDNDPASPVFFEIKRRINNCTSKQRGGVRQCFVSLLLAGQMPEAGHLVSKEPRQLVALQGFCRLMENLQATPKLRISYLREAWVHPENNSVRVTMDRHVGAWPQMEAQFDPRMENPRRPFGQKVILEAKFTNRFPEWFREMVRIFGLTQGTAAKYCEGVAAVGESVFARAPEPAEHSPDGSESDIRTGRLA